MYKGHEAEWDRKKFRALRVNMFKVKFIIIIISYVYQRNDPLIKYRKMKFSYMYVNFVKYMY